MVVFIEQDPNCVSFRFKRWVITVIIIIVVIHTYINTIKTLKAVTLATF